MQTLRTPLFFFSLCLLCASAGAQAQPAPQQAERSPVTASATTDRVRFAAPNRVARLRLEVLSPSGDVLFEANSRGSVLDWTLSDAHGNRLADGSYLCVLTVKDVAGRITQRLTLVDIGGGAATARAASASDLTPRQVDAVGPVEAEAGAVTGDNDAPAATLLAHDGGSGQLVTTHGDLSFRGGDFFTGRDKELMRLSSDGTLEVTGALLARGGIRFSDGTTLSSARELGRGAGGKGAKAGATGGRDPGVSPSAITNRLPKYDGSGVLTDSAASEVGGTLGVGTDSPDTAYKLDVRGHIVLGQTRKISFVADFNGNGEIAPGGFFGSLGQNNLNFAASTDAGLAGARVKLVYYNGGAWLSALEYANTSGGAASSLALMKNGGNVGVGTTTPQSRLDVLGDVRVSGAGNGVVFPDGSKMTTAATGGGGNVSGTGTAGALPLWTGASTLGNSVVTQSNGNVGIGTSAPATKLEVAGGATGGVSASSTGGFALHGSNPAGWAVSAEGNTRQSRDRGGWVKAMLYVDQAGTITRCFNSFEPDGGASLAGCGFTVSRPGQGVYLVGFPFAVNDRFYSLAAKAASTTEQPRLNTGANFEFDVNPNSLVVSTFLIDAAGNQTADASFVIVVY